MSISFVGGTHDSDAGTSLTLQLSSASAAAGDLAILAVSCGKSNLIDYPTGWTVLQYSPSNPPTHPPGYTPYEGWVLARPLTDVDIALDDVTVERDSTPFRVLLGVLSIWRSDLRAFEPGAQYIGGMAHRLTTGAQSQHNLAGFAFTHNGEAVHCFVNHGGHNVTSVWYGYIARDTYDAGTNMAGVYSQPVDSGDVAPNARIHTITNAKVSQWLLELHDPSEVIDDKAAPYARQMPRLLPPAPWTQDPESTLQRTMLAAARELARAADRAKDLIQESDPRTTDELLTDFEDMLDLPADGTDAERRDAIVTKLVTLQRVRPVDFQVALAPHFGQEIDDVVIVERDAADAAAMDDEAEIFRFFAYRDPDASGTYDLDAAQGAIDALAPSHTQGHAIESIDFLCDDEHSLCDRDILGA